MTDDISPTLGEKTKESNEQSVPAPPVKTARSRNKALLDKEMERQMISKLHEILCESGGLHNFSTLFNIVLQPRS